MCLNKDWHGNYDRLHRTLLKMSGNEYECGRYMYALLGDDIGTNNMPAERIALH